MTWNSYHTFENFHISGGSPRRFANLFFSPRDAATHISVQGTIKNTGEDTAKLQLQSTKRATAMEESAFTDVGGVISIVSGGVYSFAVALENADNILSFLSTSMVSGDSTNIRVEAATSKDPTWIMEAEENTWRESSAGSSNFDTDFTGPVALETRSKLDIVVGSGNVTIPENAVEVSYSAIGGTITVNGATVLSGTSSGVLQGPFSVPLVIVGAAASWQYTVYAV